MTSDPMRRSANDWRFSTEAEGSALLVGFGGQVKLFYFQSEHEQVGAWVLYAGLALGLGMKVKATPGGVRAMLEIADWIGKPKLKTGNVELALARGKVSHASLDIVTTNEWFSLYELDEARGSVFSVGAGVGIGVGLLSAIAYKGEKLLFACERIGGEFGTLGINVGDSDDGVWWVVHAWNLA